MDQNEFELRLAAILEPIQQLNFDIRQVPNRRTATETDAEVQARIDMLEKERGDRRAELRALLRENADLWGVS